MEKMEFRTSCIDEYAAYKKIEKKEVTQIFEEAGLLEMLEEDYEDLHTMDAKSLCSYFDEYLYGNFDTDMELELCR